MLYSLIGVGTPRLRDRLRLDVAPQRAQPDEVRTVARVPDAALLFLSGLFAQRPRNAVGLEIVLTEYFRLPVRVQQFRGQWLRLDPTNQSRMGGPGSNSIAGVNLVAGDKPTPCTFVEKSLFRYSDPARETVDGTLWLWTHEGRPAALLCLFTVPTDWKSWNYEWTSFSDQPLSVTGRTWWEWTPVAAEPKWLTVSGDAPAASPTSRLVQMKAIARRFTARERCARGQITSIRGVAAEEHDAHGLAELSDHGEHGVFQAQRFDRHA